MLMFGFGGLGFAAFSVGMKVGQIAEAAWWKGKLQEALTSTREPRRQGRCRSSASAKNSARALSGLAVSCAHRLCDCKLGL